MILRWFEERLDPFPAEEPAMPPRSLVAFCLHYTKGAYTPVIVMGILAALIAAIEVSLFGFLGNIVDWLSTHSRETFVEEEGWRLAMIAFVILAILPSLVAVYSLIFHQTLLGNYPMRIRWQVHRYMIRQSMGFFQDEFAGRISTKLMQTALAVRECVIKLLDVLNYVIVYFLGALVLLVSADWRLGVPMIAWLAVYMAMLYYFIPRLRRISKLQANARSDMTGRIVDSYTNIATIKMFSHSRREAVYAREAMDGFLKTVHRQMRLSTGLNMGLHAINALLLFSVGLLAINLWLEESITIGAVAVGIGIVLRLDGMSQWIMWEVSALFESIGTVEDGINSISLPREVQDRPGAQPLIVTRGAIRFEKVCFGYGGEGAVIDGLSLEVKPGEKIGLVGRSGAGKSTLVNLLLRFYDLEGGRITIDGTDIAAVQQDSLRAHIGMVTQDTSLLHRSIRDNIVYGRPDADDAAMIDAARHARADDFIQDLEDAAARKGYDAHAGERGVKLSGGQRQRIAIARVMLKDAPILVLDEATSALDSEVEAAIQDNLYRLMEGKTVIAIAHRLSTIATLDRLIILDGGRIVEEGSHDALLERNGLYAQLWKAQSGGFLIADGPGSDGSTFADRPAGSNEADGNRKRTAAE